MDQDKDDERDGIDLDNNGNKLVFFRRKKIHCNYMILNFKFLKKLWWCVGERMKHEMFGLGR